MPNDETNETTDLDVLSDRNSTLTRRKFLKRGAAAGAGAVALYMAPSMSSTRAKRAYAGITGGCDDTVFPQIDLITSSEESGDEQRINTTAFGQLIVDASDNHSLAAIEVDIVALSLSSVQPFPCDAPVTSGSLVVPFPPGDFANGTYSGIATAVDCCGNVTTQAFTLILFAT